MTAPQLEDVEEIMRMAHFLGEVGYRDLSRDANAQRLAVCRRLWREGVDERLLRMLRHYAESCGSTPVRLFCWWMDRPSRTIQKLNEMREREGWTKRALDRAVEAEREKQREEPAPIYQFRRKA